METVFDPQPVMLQSERVRLEPLELGHAEGILAAGADAEVWRRMPIAGLPTIEAVRVWIEAALTQQRTGVQIPFTIIDRASGRIAGSTRYLDIDRAHRRLEIGWTWHARSTWRTHVNTNAKLLLLMHAFDALGANRVSFKTDHENERSQRAIERLGAKREGVLRAHMIRPDGSRRDSVYYGIIRSEWPDVKARLEQRVRGARA